MNQLGLFDICRNYHRGNAESEAANGRVHGKKEAMQQRILAFIRSMGLDGATCDQIEIALDMAHQTASARVSELKKLRLIVDSGSRRETRTGSKAAVLTVVK